MAARASSSALKLLKSQETKRSVPVGGVEFLRFGAVHDAFHDLVDQAAALFDSQMGHAPRGDGVEDGGQVRIGGGVVGHAGRLGKGGLVCQILRVVSLLYCHPRLDRG